MHYHKDLAIASIFPEGPCVRGLTPIVHAAVSRWKNLCSSVHALERDIGTPVPSALSATGFHCDTLLCFGSKSRSWKLQNSEPK